jgi:hypothetical protein
LYKVDTNENTARKQGPDVSTYLGKVEKGRR